MNFRGFIFDFDGLMLDTEVPRFTAWQEAFAEYGFPLTHHDWWKTIGTGPSAYDPGQHLFELTNGKVSRSVLYEATSKRANELLEKADLLPGVATFIQKANQLGIPMVVASSSSRDWVISHLRKFGMLQYFQAVFAAEDVNKVKPDPELYFRALAQLHIPAHTVLAFEDSPNGIKAAKRAGVYCMAVPNQITCEMDLSESDQIIQSFMQILPTDSFFSK